MAKKSADKPAKSTRSSGRGGARPGAGRKPKAVQELQADLNLELIQQLTAASAPPVPPPADEPGPPIDSDVDRAMATIRRIMNEVDGDPKNKLRAAGMLLDRALGKPRQAIDLGAGDDNVKVVVYMPDNGRDQVTRPGQESDR